MCRRGQTGGDLVHDVALLDVHLGVARQIFELHFARGELSISTQGIDMAGAPRNAPQKAWNLGERLFGLQGRWSLVPLVAFQALVLLWIWRRRAGNAGGPTTRERVE